MFCPSCGRPVESGARFCPVCGAPLALQAEPAVPEVPSGSRSGSRKVAAVLVVIAVVLVAAVVALAPGEPEEPSLALSDSLVLRGGLADGTVDASLTQDGFLVSLDAAIASEHTLFEWTLTDPEGNRSVVGRGTSLDVPTADLKPGEYGLSVRCYDFAFDLFGGDVYGGTFTLYGTVQQEYTWQYEGRLYSVSASYDYSHFLEYADQDSIYLRYLGDFDRVPEFIVADDVVTGIEHQLRSLYLGTYGSDAPTDGQDYADFILAFVQACFTYQTDPVLYGEEEWWAFPVETLYHLGGDCEDTSFLCAAIYKAAGYETGIFLVPQHAIAAVALEDYTPVQLSPVEQYYYGIFSYTEDGLTYYGCETTLDDGIMGVGIISSDYRISADGTVYYEGQPSDEMWGLYTADGTMATSAAAMVRNMMTSGAA